MTKAPVIRLDKAEEVINPVFLKEIYNDTPTQIFFGGSSSGKSFFVLAQRTILDIMTSDRNFLIVRKVAVTNRNSTFNQVKKGIYDLGFDDYFKINKSEMTITCTWNNNQILFAGLDDVEKLKSITPEKGVVTDIIIEEATEISRDDYKQLTKRLRGESTVIKRIIMMFNPIHQLHWIYKEFFLENWDPSKFEFQGESLYIQKTTYRDNNFLEIDDIERIESETDPYYRDVYNDGNWGIVGNTIFKHGEGAGHWHVEDLSEISKTFDRFHNGLDFGFSSDPAAFVRVHLDKRNKRLYILDELFATGLDNDQLSELLSPKIGTELITCDSAEPKSIKELRNNRINAFGAKKGKGSIENGYRFLLGLEIIIDEKCQNVINEFSIHKWKQDKSGVALRIPEDKNNHGIDSCRYSIESGIGILEAGMRVINY